MGRIWRTLLLCAAVGCFAPAVCAFDFSYGTAFTVRKVSNQDGQLLLPRSRKKYANVRILDKELYQFLRQCEQDCRYPVEKIDFVSTDYRVSFTRENLIIAQVDFNQAIRVTFFVWKNPTDISVSAPQEITFTDKSLQKRVEQYLKELVGHL